MFSFKEFNVDSGSAYVFQSWFVHSIGPLKLVDKNVSQTIHISFNLDDSCAYLTLEIELVPIFCF